MAISLSQGERLRQSEGSGEAVRSVSVPNSRAWGPGAKDSGVLGEPPRSASCAMAVDCSEEFSDGEAAMVVSVGLSVESSPQLPLLLPSRVSALASSCMAMCANTLAFI